MPHVWRRPWPDPRLYEQELRDLTPQLNVPIIGRQALIQWFYDHGFRKYDGSKYSWDTLCGWQVRCGEPYCFYTPKGRGALNLGEPVSTVLILTRWVLCQGYKMGPRNWAGWVPSQTNAARTKGREERLAKAGLR